MSDMSDRLKSAREGAGFGSARKAAEAFGWKVSTYSAHENGQNKYAGNTARKYAKAFKTRASWLLVGDEPIKTESLDHIEFDLSINVTLDQRMLESTIETLLASLCNVDRNVAEILAKAAIEIARPQLSDMSDTDRKRTAHTSVASLIAALVPQQKK
jgi:DNA-binding XRE family transcriptional regulator